MLSLKRFPIFSRETTFSMIIVPNMEPRKAAAFGASVIASSKVAKTDSNLIKKANEYLNFNLKRLVRLY